MSVSVSVSVSLFVCPSHDLASGLSVRKMVNCAWRVQNDGKLWWRLVLTRAMGFSVFYHTQKHRKGEGEGSRKGASETDTETKETETANTHALARPSLRITSRSVACAFSKHVLSRRVHFQHARICTIVGLFGPCFQDGSRSARIKTTAIGNEEDSGREGARRRGRRTKGEEDEERPTKGEVMNIMPCDNTKNAVAS